MLQLLIALTTAFITTASVIDSAELLPVPSDYKFHARSAHGISDPGSPWITGPKGNKYQFHIGRQSWLAAREHCLAQNSDLVVIEDTEELNWILSHYAPHLPHLIERLIQIGMYSDTQDSRREWLWTNGQSLNTSVLSWVSGEPFDHANGHERCAVLRVSASVLDDVDCDLPGSETKMYRFICQRSNEAHIKHEEVNNPLWKKLQDILDFFGISRPSGDNNAENKTRPGEDEEDYWEMVKKENETTTVTTSTTETNITENEQNVDLSEVLEGSGQEDTSPGETETNSTLAFSHGTKISDNTIITDELLINKNLQKLNTAEESSSTPDSITTTVVDEIISKVETASIETTRTTKVDPFENLSSKKSDDRINYVDVLQKHMDKLEKIVNAVEHMIDPLNTDKDDNDFGGITELKIENTTLINSSKMTEIMAEDLANMEEDFVKAAEEIIEHPGINSGDIVAVPESHKENIELCENEEDPEPQLTRAQKVEKFLTSLQKFLNRSSNKELKNLVNESKLEGTSLLEKIDQAVMEQTAEQLQKMIEIQSNITEKVHEKKIKEKIILTETKTTSSADTTLKPATENILKTHDETTTLSEPLDSLTPAKEDQNSTITLNTLLTNKVLTPETSLIISNQSTPETTNQENLLITLGQNNILKNENFKEHENNGTLFPKPDFSLIKPGEGIPKEELQSVAEEAAKVNEVYKEFSRRMDTSKIVDRIQQKEANGLLKNKPLLDSLPLSSRTEKRKFSEKENNAFLELENMFLELGKNFRTITQEQTKIKN